MHIGKATRMMKSVAAATTANVEALTVRLRGSLSAAPIASQLKKGSQKRIKLRRADSWRRT